MPACGLKIQFKSLLCIQFMYSYTTRELGPITYFANIVNIEMFETRTVHIILRNPLHFFITINYYLYGIYLHIDTAPVQRSNLPRLLAW